jgi:hypothetical protein
MRMKPKLAVVPDERIDIQRLNAADVERIDWAACHIAADRRKPISLPDSRKWAWRNA